MLHKIQCYSELLYSILNCKTLNFAKGVHGQKPLVHIFHKPIVGIRENPNIQEMKILIKIVGKFSGWCLYNVLKGEIEVHEAEECKQLLLPLCPGPHLLSSLETFVISFSNQHMIWGNWTFHGWNGEEKGTSCWQTKHISTGTDIITSMNTGHLSYESTYC